MAGKLKVYEYEKCSTCRNAIKFLEALQGTRKVAYERIPIVERPPGLAELRVMLGHLGGDVRKLFNTSGVVYREMGLGAKLGSMSESEALKLLSTHGKLVKRPFVLGAGVGLVGFRAEEWRKKF